MATELVAEFPASLGLGSRSPGLDHDQTLWRPSVGVADVTGLDRIDLPVVADVRGWAADHDLVPHTILGYSPRMTLGRSLDNLPGPALSPEEKLQHALEMYEEGVAMQRLSLRRRFPEISQAELDRKLQLWLARADEAR